MKIVIVGAGFGGLRLARKLRKKPGIEVLLLDRFNHHQFQPLFYQVATGGLDASNISFPLRKVFRKSGNVRVRLTDVTKIEPTQNKVSTTTGEIFYDILVLATGASTNFFGNSKLARHAMPMKSTVEALQLRYRILQNFEKASILTDEQERQKLLNLVVVGGGPTGVELAGSIAEMKRYILPKEYPELDISRMNIYLLEGAGRTLAAMSEKSSERSMRYLEKLGVTLFMNSIVEDYDGNTVRIKGRIETIESALVIWAAGIKGNIPDGISGELIATGSRIKIDKYCRVQGRQNIFAIGDLAYLQDDRYPVGHPQVAPVAIQQATVLAKNLVGIAGKHSASYAMKEFRYKDKGSMATVGRNLAVVDVPKPKLRIGGFFAWIIWMSLHLMLILGIKNRFFVFVNWLYSYITYDQNLRLIFKEPKYLKERI